MAGGGGWRWRESPVEGVEPRSKARRLEVGEKGFSGPAGTSFWVPDNSLPPSGAILNPSVIVGCSLSPPQRSPQPRNSTLKRQAFKDNPNFKNHPEPSALKHGGIVTQCGTTLGLKSVVPQNGR